MTVRTEKANFDTTKLLMIDRLVDGTVLVILKDGVPDAQADQRARRLPQRQLTLTGVCADEAWR